MKRETKAVGTSFQLIKLHSTKCVGCKENQLAYWNEMPILLVPYHLHATFVSISQITEHLLMHLNLPFLIKNLIMSIPFIPCSHSYASVINAMGQVCSQDVVLATAVFHAWKLRFYSGKRHGPVISFTPCHLGSLIHTWSLFSNRYVSLPMFVSESNSGAQKICWWRRNLGQVGQYNSTKEIFAELEQHLNSFLSSHELETRRWILW